MDCLLQLFQDDAWRDCARVHVLHPDRGGALPASFEYELEHAFEAGSEPVSLTYPINAAIFPAPAC